MTPWLLKSFTPTPAAPMRVLIEGDDAPKTLWTSADYLGFGAGARAVAAARSTLDQFSLGSCGPRGFYGTTTVHLDLEAALARFMGSHESITYSDDTATIVSVIPAFAKRGDVLLIDSAANYGVQQGAHLSRSKVVWWNHNDTADLERHLRAVREADSGKSKGAALQQRRFIVVEGLYASTGELCPLPEVGVGVWGARVGGQVSYPPPHPHPTPSRSCASQPSTSGASSSTTASALECLAPQGVARRSTLASRRVMWR